MPASKSVRRYGQDPAASDRPCGSGDCYRTSGRTHGRTGRPKGLTSGGPRPTSTIKRYLKANGERRHAKSCTHGPAPPALGRGKGVLPTVSTASVAARRGLGDVVHRPLSFPFNQLVLSTVTCNLPPPLLPPPFQAVPDRRAASNEQLRSGHRSAARRSVPVQGSGGACGGPVKPGWPSPRPALLHRTPTPGGQHPTVRRRKPAADRRTKATRLTAAISQPSLAATNRRCRPS